jgi:hypothetical protein
MKDSFYTVIVVLKIPRAPGCLQILFLLTHLSAIIVSYLASKVNNLVWRQLHLMVATYDTKEIGIEPIVP